MDNKVFLKEEQLKNVSGGTGAVGTVKADKPCPDCGSENVILIEERGDAGYFMCEDCGCTFYGDI